MESARYCAGDGAGKYHRDEVRNIVGSFWNNKNGLFTDSGYANGAMRRVQATDSFSNNANRDNSNSFSITFDASCVVPTGPENVPPHYGQPVALYLGAPA